jgi:hypothetical protein
VTQLSEHLGRGSGQELGSHSLRRWLPVKSSVDPGPQTMILVPLRRLVGHGLGLGIDFIGDGVQLVDLDNQKRTVAEARFFNRKLKRGDRVI